MDPERSPSGLSELGPIQPDRPPFLRRHRSLTIFLACALLIGAGLVAYDLLTKPLQTDAGKTTTKIQISANPNHWKGSVDPSSIPLGDGKVSTTPKAGYVYSCTTSFRGGGAEHAGPWINGSAGTWNSQTKLAVKGAVTWPAAAHSENINGQTRTVTTNDLPKGYTTGIFPIAQNDQAYQYDHNPNSIGTQSLTYQLPLNPSAATAPHCTGLGPIGVLTNGVALFNALDAAGRDAAAHETQDSCNGHPDGQEMYHYHDIPVCLRSDAKGTSTLVGYANDGYGIYVERDAKGNLPTNANLDECHGRTSQVKWNGKKTTVYHYDATLEYPYTVGCYHGSPVTVGGVAAQGQGQGRAQPQPRP